MALARVKTWSAGDVLTAADLNAEFGNIYNNGQSLVQPWVGNFDLDGNTLLLDADADTSLDASTDDTIDITINGADDFRFTANTFTALSGSSISVANGNITVDAGNVTVTDGQTILADPGSHTNTVVTPLTVRSTTSGTPAAGIGTGILFQSESADETTSDFGQAEFAASDVTAGSEDTYFQILTRVAGAALTATYRWIATGAFKAIFTHANSADRTYTLPNASTTILGTDTTATVSNKTLDSSNVLTGCVKTGSIVTATGSASGSGVSIATNITLNDYAFPPNIQFTGGTGIPDLQPFNGADSGTTVGRLAFGTPPACATYDYVVRWRYVTASDNPTIWAVIDPATGVILATWTSDDPTLDDVPGLEMAGLQSIKLTAADLEHLTVLNSRAAEAADFIRDRKMRMQHQAYRALQLHANDLAPSKWLLDHVNYDLVSRRVIYVPRAKDLRNAL